MKPFFLSSFFMFQQVILAIEKPSRDQDLERGTLRGEGV